MSKSVVKKLSAAALTLMPPCAAAVRCHPHRHMHVCAVACLPSRNVSVVEKGSVIWDSVYLKRLAISSAVLYLAPAQLLQRLMLTSQKKLLE